MTRFIRTEFLLPIAGLGLLLISVLPFLLLTPYIHPQADDYSMNAVLTQMSYWDAQVHWYMNWTGRFSAFMIAGLIHPMQYGFPEGIRLVAFIWILLFACSVWFFVRSFTSFRDSIFPTSLVLTTYLWQIPSPAEAFYWIPATVSYQMGISMQLLFFGLLSRKPTRWPGRLTLLLLAVLIPGSSEINLIIFLSIFMCISLYKLINRQNISGFSGILMVIALIMSALSFFSPGNSVRTQELVHIAGAGPVHDIGFSVKTGLGNAKSGLLHLFSRTPILLFSLLLLLLRPAFHPLKELKAKPGQMLLYWLAVLGLYLFLQIPYIYQSGVMHLPGRLNNVIVLFFVFAWFVGILLSSAAFSKVNWAGSDERTTLLSSAFILVFSFLQLTIPNKIEHAWMDRLGGKARQYSQFLDQRDAFAQSVPPQSSLSLAPLPVKPSSLYLVDLESDSTDWKNQAFAIYFNLHSVQLGEGNRVIQAGN